MFGSRQFTLHSSLEDFPLQSHHWPCTECAQGSLRSPGQLHLSHIQGSIRTVSKRSQWPSTCSWIKRQMGNKTFSGGRQGGVGRMRLCGIPGKRGYTGQLYLCYRLTSSSGLPNFSFGIEKPHQTQNTLMDLFHSATLSSNPTWPFTRDVQTSMLTNILKLPWFNSCEQTDTSIIKCFAWLYKSSIYIFSIQYLPYWGSIINHFKETITHKGCFPPWFLNTGFHMHKFWTSGSFQMWMSSCRCHIY